MLYFKTEHQRHFGIPLFVSHETCLWGVIEMCGDMAKIVLENASKKGEIERFLFPNSSIR